MSSNPYNNFKGRYYSFLLQVGKLRFRDTKKPDHQRKSVKMSFRKNVDAVPVVSCIKHIIMLHASTSPMPHRDTEHFSLIVRALQKNGN